MKGPGAAKKCCIPGLIISVFTGIPFRNNLEKGYAKPV